MDVLVHMLAHALEARSQARVSFSGAGHFVYLVYHLPCFMRQRFFTGTWGLPISLDWLADEPLGSPISASLLLRL